MSTLDRSKDSIRSGLPEGGSTADRAGRPTLSDRVPEADALHSLRVALIGYGEVGGIVGRTLHKHSLASLRTYDRLTRRVAARPQRLSIPDVEEGPDCTKLIRGRTVDFVHDCIV